MPKLMIDLPNDTHQILKEKAKADRRSLTNYITTILIGYTGTLPPTTPVFYPSQPYMPSSVPTPPFIPTVTTYDATATQPNTDPSIPTTIGGRKVKSIIFEKEKTLTPEEQKLQEMKVQEKENKMLDKREQKWYEEAKKFMKDYWDDDLCRKFAHDHIYRGQHIPEVA